MGKLKNIDVPTLSYTFDSPEKAEQFCYYVSRRPLKYKLDAPRESAWYKRHERIFPPLPHENNPLWVILDRRIAMASLVEIMPCPMRHSHEMWDEEIEICIFLGTELTVDQALELIQSDRIELAHVATNDDSRASIVVHGPDAMTRTLSALLSFGEVNLHQLITTCIGDTLQLLGIEAARASLVKQLQALDDGTVNIRHILLVVDCMTYLGTVQGIRYNGVGHLTSSVFGRASFERPISALVDGAIHHAEEVPNNLSRALIMGSLQSIGTGYDGTQLVSPTLGGLYLRFKLETSD